MFFIVLTVVAIAVVAILARSKAFAVELETAGVSTIALLFLSNSLWTIFSFLAVILFYSI